jgi:hypothetical protein
MFRDLLDKLLDRAINLSKLDATRYILEKGRSLYKGFGNRHIRSAGHAALEAGDLSFLEYLLTEKLVDQYVDFTKYASNVSCV